MTPREKAIAYALVPYENEDQRANALQGFMRCEVLVPVAMRARIRPGRKCRNLAIPGERICALHKKLLPVPEE